MCCSGGQKDQFNLIINLDDVNKIRRVVDGGAFCMEWSWFCADAVTAIDIAYLLEGTSRDI
jgi:hypothetical protein